MAKSNKLVDKMFKIGFSVDPLFMDEYGVFQAPTVCLHVSIRLIKSFNIYMAYQGTL